MISEEMKSTTYQLCFILCMLINVPQNDPTSKDKSLGKICGNSEAATRDVLLKRVFLKMSQNSQENTCARVSFLIKL